MGLTRVGQKEERVGRKGWAQGLLGFSWRRQGREGRVPDLGLASLNSNAGVL